MGNQLTVMRLFCCPSFPLLYTGGKDKTMKTPKTPLEFDYDLWTTEDGTCMVRIKVNEPRFSNFFIEKRGSQLGKALGHKAFPFSCHHSQFSKNLKIQKQNFYIGLVFRQCFPI